MIEARIQSIIKTKNTLKIMPGFAHDIPAANVQLSIQAQITSARTRLNVTTCLYLSPMIRARSLSTLIAVDVNIDTAVKTMVERTSNTSQIMPRSGIGESRAVIAKSGCEMRPTQRSVTAKHRNKSFVGG